MNGTVQRRDQAKRDLVELADYLDQRSQALSDRFLEAVERTLTSLAGMPGLGAPYPLQNPALQGLRHSAIQGFPNHIVFYLPTADGIDVVRVLHGARNIESILEREA